MSITAKHAEMVPQSANSFFPKYEHRKLFIDKNQYLNAYKMDFENSSQWLFLLLYIGTNILNTPWIWFVEQTRIKQLVNNLCMNLNVKDTLKKGISKIAVIFYSHYKMSSGCQLKSLFDTCQNIYIIVTNLQSDVNEC